MGAEGALEARGDLFHSFAWERFAADGDLYSGADPEDLASGVFEIDAADEEIGAPFGRIRGTLGFRCSG